MKDTIAAIATPPGIGAIGVIRISGEDAISKATTLFPRKDLSRAKSHTLHYGPLQYDSVLLDEVLLSIFRSPHSYTGENSVEISCHGSPYILQKVMETLMHIGIRPAEPGEFTLRAFLNGKLDLSQAEAVADLIVSETEAAHRAALFQMRGGFSKKIKDLRSRLLQFVSLIELELDFAEEDVEFANRAQLNSLLHEIETEVTILADSFRLGNVIKSGVKVVIAGRPNAGKSTLLNEILNEERAIVSDIPGTTRDTIEDTITIEGIQFRFIDTAGIRSSTDVLENIGIERTFGKLREAQIIIYLFDVNTTDPEQLVDDLRTLPEDKIVIPVGNKIDLWGDKGQGTRDIKDTRKNTYRRETTPIGFKHLFTEELLQSFPVMQAPIFISGRQGENVESLKATLLKQLHLDTQRSTDTLVTNIRHYHALQRILVSIASVREGLRMGLTSDFLVIDIRQALHEMGEITGEITTDEILGNIFSQFCIGK